MKEFKIIIGPDGTTTYSLKNYEGESPKIAKEFEDALGEKATQEWRPGVHPHVHVHAGGGFHKH